MNVVLFGEYCEEEVLNGPQKFTKRLFHALAISGNDVTLIGYFQDGTRYSRIKKLFGKEILYSNGNSRAVRLGILRIFMELCVRSIDVVHILHFLRYPVIVFLFAGIRRFPVIQTIHSIQVFEYKNNSPAIGEAVQKTNIRFERMLYWFDSTLVFVSRLTEELHRSIFGERKNSAVIYHGIDEYFLRVRKLHSPHPVPRCVFMGESMRKEKGTQRLVELLNNIDFPLELYVISDSISDVPVRRPDIRIQYVQRMPAEDYAKFLCDKDYYLLLSDFETFSIAAAEAMAAGVVPLVSQRCGISEIIQDGINGLTYDISDPQSLAEVMSSSIARMLHYDQMSQHARMTVAHMSWDHTAAEYTTLYSLMRNSRHA